jgi:hypothetical protein
MKLYIRFHKGKMDPSYVLHMQEHHGFSYYSFEKCIMNIPNDIELRKRIMNGTSDIQERINKNKEIYEADYSP